MVKKEIGLKIKEKHKQLWGPRLLRNDDTRLIAKVWRSVLQTPLLLCMLKVMRRNLKEILDKLAVQAAAREGESSGD